MPWRWRAITGIWTGGEQVEARALADALPADAVDLWLQELMV